MNDTEAIEDDEGNRIFKIQLPSGKKVEATVDPSLKMMDLLISIASNNKLNPTAYQIAQPSKLKGRPPLVYTPSQSAGDIEGSFIMLLPKKEREQFSIYKGKKSGVFEHTVRLTIHSSKNHKMIFRTNPDKTLGEVFPKICEERGVEESHYVMRVHKHKEDADPTQTIQSFGVLDFDLVEVENEGKKKVGLLGKLKKKEDEDERTEKSKPNANGSHNNHRSPPENKVQKQNSDGTVHHKPDGGVPSKPDGVTSHKKRPAPLPPSVSTANIQPSDVQAQSNTLEKSKPKVSRVSTKKRRAPAAPVAVVPINIEESSEQKKETTGDKEGVVDNSQRVGGHDESDAPSQVGIDRGQSMEVVTDGAPPSPAVSHGSSQGLSTSDKDKSSVTGSVSEHDNQGSIPPAPSKPPRLNLYSDEEIDAEFKLEGKPVFVPPSPPLTPPSASVPTEDVRKLIAEGRLSIEEDYPDGDASTNPDSSSVHDDEQFSSEENLASSHQSLDDIDGEIEIILAKVDGPEVKVAKTDSVAPDEEPKVAEISLGDVNIGGNAGFMVGTLPAELPPPPYVEQVPPPPMPPSPPPIPPEEEYLTVEDDLPPPPDDIPPPPPGEDPPRRKVCKCIDPENGEDCDHYTPGAVIKEGENVEDCPFARNNSDNDGPPGGPPDEPPEGGESIVLSRGDQPILSEEKKDLSSSQSLDTDILSQEKILSSPPPTKPKSVTSPKPDLSSSQSVETEIFFQEKIPSSPPPTKPKPVTSPKPDLSSSQSIETEILSQEKILSSPPPTKSKPVTSPKPVVLPKPKRFSLSKDVAHPLDNQLSFPKLTDVKLAEVGHEKPVVSDARRRFFSQMFLSVNTAITPQTGSMSSKDENAAPDDKITTPTLESDVPVAKNAVLKVVNTAMSPDKAQTENTIPQSEIESKSHSPEKVTSKPDNIALETNNNIPKAGHTMSEFDGTIFKGETNTLPQMELECDIALKPGDIHKADITTQKADITTQKADTTTQKADITTQKADITTQKADTTTQKADITTQKEECSKQATSETGKRSDKPKTQLERVKMKPGDDGGKSQEQGKY